jgi:ABC-type thiamine transport system substrate-binding protein
MLEGLNKHLSAMSAAEAAYEKAMVRASASFILYAGPCLKDQSNAQMSCPVSFACAASQIRAIHERGCPFFVCAQ